MNLPNWIIGIAAYILVEFIVSTVKGSGPWLARNIMNVTGNWWKEHIFLQNTLKNERFSQWRPKSNKFVALKAIRAQKRDLPQEVEQALLDILEDSLRKHESVLILGEPGAGKTTVLEAFNYRLAERAYRRSTLLAFIWILIALITLWWSGIVTLIWVIFFPVLIWMVFFPLMIKRLQQWIWITPFFLELRAFFDSDVLDYFKKEIREQFGDTSVFPGEGRIIFLLDGTNEINKNQYARFIESWNKQQKNKFQTFMTARSDERPLLQRVSSLWVRELDDQGVYTYIRIYLREKKIGDIDRKRISDSKIDVSEGATQNYFDELKQKRLLAEQGIGRNPYWLRMLVLSDLQTRNRGELLMGFAKQLILREIESKPEERKRTPAWNIVPYEVEMEALSKLALAMHNEGKVGFEGEAEWIRSVELIEKALDRERRPEKPHDVLYEAEAASLLRLKYNSQVDFSHNLVQEFFAAYALRRKADWEKILLHCNNPWWWETFFLLGGVLATQEANGSSQTWAEFIRTVLSHGKDDEHLIVTMGLLQSISEPHSELSRYILEQLAFSIQNNVSPTMQQAVWELERIIGHDAIELFTLMFLNSDKTLYTAGTALLCISRQAESKEVLRSAIYSSSNTTDIFEILASVRPAPTDLLISLLAEDEESLQRNAILALGKIANQDARESLIRLLDNKNKSIRMLVISTLGRIGDDEVIDALRNCVSDTDEEICSQAVIALLQANHERADNALVSAINASDRKKIEFVIKTMIGIVETSGDAKSINTLLRTLQRSDLDNDLYLLVTRTLIHINNRFARNALKEALHHQKSAVRIIVANALIKSDVNFAIAALSHALNSADEQVRTDALKALASTNESQVLNILTDVLTRESSELVRKTAVLMLGKVGDRRAIPVLRSVLRDETTSLHEEAVIALGLIGGDQVVDDLEDILNRNLNMSERIVPEVVKALVKIGTERAMDIIVSLLINPKLKATNQEVRAQAAEVLGDVRNQNAIIGLGLALKDENKEVRKNAALALGRIADPSTFDDMKNAFEQEDDMTLAAIESEVLVKIDRRRAISMWTDQLQDKRTQFRHKAVMGLGWINDREAFELLVDTLRADASEDVRVEAAKSLRKIGTPWDDDVLIKALQDKNQNVALEMIELFGAINNEQSINALMSALLSENANIRLRATEELGKSRNNRVIFQLIDALLAEKDFRVRDQMMKALAEICNDQEISSEGPSYQRYVMDALEYIIINDDNPDTRISAVEGLGTLRIEKTNQAFELNILSRALRDKNNEVRQRAGEIIRMRPRGKEVATLLSEARTLAESNAFRRPRSYSDLKNW